MKAQPPLGEDTRPRKAGFTLSSLRQELKKLLDVMPEEKLVLLERYARALHGTGGKPKVDIADPAKHLRGLHKEIWQGVDVERYLEQERDSWDA